MCTSERREVIVTGDEKGAPLGPPPQQPREKGGVRELEPFPIFTSPSSFLSLQTPPRSERGE